MQEIRTSLVYKRVNPRKKTAGKSPAIVLLHGRGADENDLLGLAPFLDERLTIISVRAPFPFEYGGFTYFPLRPDGSAEPGMLMDSHGRLEEFIQGVASLPDIDPRKIFLTGFSMGTVMAYALSLGRPERFAGVIAQSGFVRDHPDLHFKWDRLDGCPFIITHGVHDPVIPIALARATKEKFSKSNAEYIYKEYSMGHEIGDESLSDVCDWLRKKIG